MGRQGKVNKCSHFLKWYKQKKMGQHWGGLRLFCYSCGKPFDCCGSQQHRRPPCSSPTGIHTPPALDLGWPGWPGEYSRRLHYTWRHCGFCFVYPLLSSITCFGENQLPCCENAQAFPWRVSCGKEPKPAANSQTNLLAVWVIFLGDWPSSLVKPSYDCSLS